MILIGNFFLAVATLVFLLLFNLIYFSKKSGGDAIVGYAWVLFLGIVVFSICLCITTAIIGMRGGFAWVGSSGGQRTLLVIGGLILILIGNGFFLLDENPTGVPMALRLAARFIPVILTPLLLIGTAVLLNPSQTLAPPMIYKWAIYAGLFCCVLAIGSILAQRMRIHKAITQDQVEFDDKIHQNQLDHIDKIDLTKDWVFLLTYTDINKAADVRIRALDKVKMRPDWQEELVRRLENDWAPEAFTFLAVNEVDDKTMFPEPIRQGVLIQARLIREDIRRRQDAKSMHAGMFAFEVVRVLRTVQRFEGMGTDFRPAVQELRAALDERTSFKKPDLVAKVMLDQWLAGH